MAANSALPRRIVKVRALLVSAGVLFSGVLLVVVAWNDPSSFTGSSDRAGLHRSYYASAALIFTMNAKRQDCGASPMLTDIYFASRMV